MSLFNVYPLFDITPVRAEDVFVYDEKDTQIFRFVLGVMP